MRIVAVITAPAAVDRILRHVGEHGENGVHEQRGPPQEREALAAGVTEWSR
jgi:hypothetical protein